MKDVGKRELNKARRRAAIVEVATRYFLDHGYAATSMSAIADEMGGSKATMWAHFSSKEELFSAVVDAQVDAFAQSLHGILVGQSFSIEGLHEFCLTFLKRLLRDDTTALYRLIMGEGERFPEIKEVFYSRGPARVRQELQRFFASRFGGQESTALARLTISAISGYRSDVLIRPHAPTHADLAGFVDSLIHHLRLPDDGPRSERQAAETRPA